jgi:outer membrane protein
MRYFAILIVCSLLTPILNAQTPQLLKLSLDDVVELAQSDAPDVLIAKTRMINSHWRFRSFEANYRPRIDLTGTFADVDRTISAITLPTGQDAFVTRAQMSNFTGVFLNQDIALTGGSVYATTGLRRIDLFPTNVNPAMSSYLSTPIIIGFEQPLFRFNQLKWDKRTEPIRYAEATRNYAADMENIAFQASALFFDVLIAQLNLEAAEKDKANADTLFQISTGRFEVGRIAETELLQIELTSMNADAALAQSRLDLQTSTERLRTFLGLKTRVTFECIPPYEIPEFLVTADAALEYARQNRSEIVNFELQLMEADQALAQARGSSGFNATVSGSFGLTQTAVNLGDAYIDPLDQQRFRISLNLPIADWGKRQAQLEQASTNLELVQMIVEQQRINFEQDVLLKVQQFDLIRQQVALAKRAFEVSQKRLEMTRNRYYIGKIIVTELNIAIAEQDNARRAYIAALRSYWLAHYDLRRITLHDFSMSQNLFRSLDF